MAPHPNWPEPLSAPHQEAIDHAWGLDASVVYLNHGSFGACPRAILDIQQQLQKRAERQPVRFFAFDWLDLLDDARETLAAFVGVDADSLAFVSNATAGVNTVLRSLRFAPGDELVTTNHAYNACKNALRFVADRWGATPVIANVPFPIETSQQIVQAITAAVTDRTKLVMIDHITSPTGIIFPVAEIVDALTQRGIDTLVDGAHAPGMVDLDIEAIAPAYYTANCHKWLCSPKGAALLYVRPDRQDRIRPLAISHGANAATAKRSRFRLEFDWTGTDDPTAFLAAAACVDYMPTLMPGGWPAIRRRNLEMARAARRVLCDAFDVPPLAPDTMLGSMASLPLPPAEPGEPSFVFADLLQRQLIKRHAIEVPVFHWPAAPRRLMRISAQLYNKPRDYERLAAAVLASWDR